MAPGTLLFEFLRPLSSRGGACSGKVAAPSWEGRQGRRDMFSWFSDTPDFHSPPAAVPEILN